MVVIPGLFAPASLGSTAELAAAAAASPRPVECRSSGVGDYGSIWLRVRPPALAEYCGTLARGFAELGGRPKLSLELAATARALEPAQRLPRLLAGRALFRLGRPREAWALLEPLLAAESPPVDDAPSLLDVARAALSVGALDAAERGYRQLVARAGLLGSAEARRVTYIEAASLLLSRGSSGIDAAEGYLAEARALPLAGDRDLMLALGALALHRAGRRERARALARETDGPWDLEAQLTPLEKDRVAGVALGSPPEEPIEPGPLAPRRILLRDGELHAAIAVLAEGRDAALSRAHWRAFLASPAGKGPWAAHALAALRALGGRP